MIPLGSSGGRQLTSTEDESRAFSCSSSGGVDGPEGERRARSVITHPGINPHSCGMCIMSRRDSTCVSTSCVLASAPPGYSSEGPIRPRRSWAVARVTRHGSGEHDRLTGFNSVFLKKAPPGFPALLGSQRQRHDHTWVCSVSQQCQTAAAGPRPANTLTHI